MGDRPRLLLASGSPRRADLLARLHLDPARRPADVDESPLPDEPPEHLVDRLAAAKADAVTRGDDDVVLAADTVVALDDRALGKPRDDHQAAEMLAALSGRTHRVVTAIAVRRGRRRLAETVVTHVTFRELSVAEIAWYVRTGEPRDKAGAYALQGAGAVLVQRIRGSDTNVIGLPLAETVALLRRAGFEALLPSR